MNTLPPSLTGLSGSIDPYTRARMVAQKQREEADHLASVQQRWQEFPGSAPGGSGSTGLMSTDSQGWSDMLNENSWASNQLRAAKGQGPMDIHHGDEIGALPPLQGGPVQNLKYGAVQDGPPLADPSVRPKVPPSLASLQGEGQYVDDAGHVQIRKKSKPKA